MPQAQDTVEKPGADGPPDDSADALHFEATATSQDNRIFLDQVGDELFHLTDTEAKCRTILEGTWELTKDDHTQRYLVAGVSMEGQPLFKEVDEALGKDVYVDAKGVRFLVTLGPEGPVRYFNLDAHQAKFKDANIELSVGSADATVTVVGYAMAFPRDCGQRVFWGLFDFYGVLSLTTFGGQRCKWTNAGIPKWGRALETHLPGSHFVFSRHRNVGDDKLKLPWSQRCLPQPSASTVAVLRMLSLFTFASAANGGLKGVESRKAASEVLDSLIGMACRRGVNVKFPIVLDERWQCRWPRPSAHYSDEGTLQFNVFFTEACELDVGELFGGAFVPRQAQKVQKAWVAKLWALADFAGQSRAPAKTVLKAMFATKKTESFAAQVIFRIATEVELALGAASKENAAADKGVFRSMFPVVGELDMEEKLQHYVTVSREASRGHRVVSIATDKANPAFLNLQNSIVSYPSGVAVLCCPQVDRGFVGEEQMTSRRITGKRPLADTGANLGDPLGDAERQRAWLARTATSMDPKSWKPVTWHRLAARKWALAIDTQLNYSTEFGGLKFFRRDKSDRWKSWEEWPTLGVSIDMGSDGVAGWCALAYGYDVNTFLLPDASHSAQRSFEGTLKDAGLWDFWLLMLISWNLEHGPHSDRARHYQIKEGLQTLLKNRTPAQVPLFQQLAGAMVADLENNNAMQFPRERPIEDELWDWLVAYSKSGTLHRRVSTNRFGGTQNAAMKHAPYWSVGLFTRTFLALEMGWLKGSKFVEKLTAKGSGASATAAGGTHPKHLQVDDRVLRQCCQNAVVISVLALDDANNKRVVNAVVEVQRPLNDYRTHQNRTCRSGPECSAWLVGQTTGEHDEHLCNFVRLLSNVDVLIDAGFTLPGTSGIDMEDIRIMENSDLFEQVEDEHADLFGQMVLSMVKHRAFRGLHFHGWPDKMAGILQGEAEAATVIKDFESDAKLWDEFVKFKGKCANGKQVQKRGVMGLLCVQQYAEAFKETGYVHSKKLNDLVQRRSSVNLQTQIVEDLNGQQASISHAGQGRRLRIPSTCMSSCLEQDIIANRHRFKHVPMEYTPEPEQGKLPMEAFQPARQAMSFDFSGIASTSASLPWYSTVANNMTMPHADLALLASAKEAGSFGLLSKAWLGEVSSFKHRLAIGFRKPQKVIEWFICVHSMPKSAVILWPAALKTCGGASRLSYFEPVVGKGGVVVKGIFDLKPEVVVGAAYEWKSWAWQLGNVPDAAQGKLKPAVRAMIKSTDIKPVKEIMCENAFWALPRSSVSEFAEYFKVHCDPGLSFVDLLWTVIKEVLELPDDRVLEILHKRLCLSASECESSTALFEVDEAWEVVDHMDMSKVKQAQKEAESSLSGHKEFRNKYRAKAKEVHSSGGPAGKKLKAEKGLVVPAHHISQPEAKRFIPPASFVWRSLTRNQWCGHVPPYRRLSESFAKNGGSPCAFQVLLRRMWAQHLDKVGAEEAACPIAGLFGGIAK